jgi:hypothetical protein
MSDTLLRSVAYPQASLRRTVDKYEQEVNQALQGRLEA